MSDTLHASATRALAFIDEYYQECVRGYCPRDANGQPDRDALTDRFALKHLVEIEAMIADLSGALNLQRRTPQ